MDFELTEEQSLIRETARRFVEDYDPRRSAQIGFDAAVWAALADLGFLAIAQPEDLGGMGGPVELALVAEAFGRGPVIEPYVGLGIFPAQVIAGSGNEDMKARLLPAISAGKRIIAVAYREPGVAEASLPMLTRAARQGDGYQLSGRKALVVGGASADSFIVSAAAEDGELLLFVVNRGLKGVRVLLTPLVDGSACLDVEFHGVGVTDADVLARGRAAEEALGHGLRHAILGTAAMTSGAMAAALGQAAAYMTVRKQFGVPLSEFQVLRHKIADMAIDCEMAEGAILKALAAFQDPDRHDPVLALSGAKVLLDELGHRVCGQAIQIHGGMGMTEECGVGRYFTCALLNRSLFGMPLEHGARYVAQLRATDTAVELAGA